jgi:hypothetical protein
MIYDAFTQYTANKMRQMFEFHGTNSSSQAIFGLYDTKKLWHAGHDPLQYVRQSRENGYYSVILPWVMY